MFDVGIVGAGPAGAWAARGLARHGARVLLLDGSHPREKPCGGGVTGRALSLVRDAFAPSPLEAVPIAAARFVDTAGPTGTTARRTGTTSPPRPASGCRVPLAAGAGLVVSNRRHFDQRLLEAACASGVTFRDTRVLDVERDAGGYRIRTAKGVDTVRRLIGADGANSLVRRRLAAPLDRGELSMATGYYAHGVTSDEIVIEFVDDPPGYLWSFPRADHLAIGICAQADAGVTATALRARAARWIEDTGLAAGARLEPYAWPIPSLRPRALQAPVLGGPDWALVGDAAGLVDPITREGIFFALQSAALAADAFASASGPAGYAAATLASIVPDLRRAALLKDGFFTPRFRHLILDALERSEGIRQVMADLIAGTQPYEGLRWRLARTFEFGIAVRFLTARTRDSRPAPAPAHPAD